MNVLTVLAEVSCGESSVDCWDGIISQGMSIINCQGITCELILMLRVVSKKGFPDDCGKF